MKILIADDSRVMRTIVIRTLRQAGFGDHVLHEAVDGADALRQIESVRPDLVLSAWRMPRHDGIAILKHLRSQGNAVPFGFVTFDGTPEIYQLAMDEGANFFIAKPFTAETFRQVLGPLLGAAGGR